MFLTLSIMALGPVVASTTLPKAEVVRPEDLAIVASSDRVHGARLQVNQNRPGNVVAIASLIVVDLDPLQLELRVPVVLSIRINAVLVGDNLPELLANLNLIPKKAKIW